MGKTTVLIAEDEAIVAADLAGKLGQLGYEVVGSAARGEAAVELALRLLPGVVLMDVRLKGEVDGIEAATAIQRSHDAPVIYLTAHSDSATLERAKVSGPYGYILKPFEERELATTIEMALYKHQSDRRMREQRELLRVTLASIGDAVIACDTDGLVTFLNQSAEALTGWSGDEARHRPMGELFRLVGEEEGQSPPQDPVARLLREERPGRLAGHGVLVARDGRRISVEESAAPILATDGRVIGAVLVFRDVGEQRLAQSRLRRSHEELELRVAERTQRLKELNDALEERAAEHARLEAANETLRASRVAALNLMEDSLLARREAEETSDRLRREITERERVEQALRESEGRVRLKLESILAPEGDLELLKLEDIIEVGGLQALMDDFFAITRIPMGVIDVEGKVLVGVGWQRICTEFHRRHPGTLGHCLESDTRLSAGIPEGEYRLYKCMNGMWDAATPIMLGGRHLGNIFIGQFFFRNEQPDLAAFRAQAVRHGFPEGEYLAALEQVPRVERAYIDIAMAYYMKLASMISRLSYSNLKLARALAERETLTESLRESELFYSQTLESIPGMVFTTRPDGYCDFQSRQWVEFTGVPMSEHLGDGWNGLLHPDDRPRALVAWRDAVAGRAPYDLEYRVRRHDGEFQWFKVIGRPIRDAEGETVRWFGVAVNIDAIKRAERELGAANRRLDLMAESASRLLVSDTPQLVVDELCRRVMEFLDCQFFFNFLADEREGRLRLNACAGIPEEEARRIEWLEYGVAVCGCAARDACRIVAEDIQSTPDPRTELVASYGVRAYACHPLLAQGRVLGTISFGTRTRNGFGDEELTLMKAVADQVAIAMQRKQTEQALKSMNDELEELVSARTRDLAASVESLRREIGVRKKAQEDALRLNRLYRVLSRLNQAIARIRERDHLFTEACRIAVEEGGFRLAWVGLLEGEGGEVRGVAAHGATAYLEGIRVTADGEPTGLGPTGIAVREGGCYFCNDFLGSPVTRPWHERGRSHGMRASASIALREEERVIGALTLYADREEFFDSQQEELVRQMGADISYALGNIVREQRRREAERALREETVERLRAVEALREQERLLIQQSRQAAMGEMIGNIAHQWRQPLNNLGVTIQGLLFFYDMNEFDRDFLEKGVKKSMELIKHMSGTIDDFRNYFRPDKEKVEFRVSEAVESTLSLVRDSFMNQHISIRVEAEEDPPVFGYRNEFAQALLNILNNARDVLAERKVAEPRVTIRVGRSGGRSLVVISDNAGGIPEEIRERIFEPYFTTKGPQQGTGIGLFMSKSIIEKSMGGKLAAHNNADGAEFRIEV